MPDKVLKSKIEHLKAIFLLLKQSFIFLFLSLIVDMLQFVKWSF
jgi:hypothetical protein